MENQNMKIIETPATKVIKDMEHTNIVTFNTIEEQANKFIEYKGEIMLLRPFSAYNFEVILNGEKICLNPMNYTGNLKTKEYPLNIETMKTCEFWLIYNHKKVILYEAITNEFLGEITKVLDPRNIQERLHDMKLAGEI